jgi:hypothetical protein
MLHQEIITPTQRAARDVRARLSALRAPEKKTIPIVSSDKPEAVPIQREEAMVRRFVPQPADPEVSNDPEESEELRPSLRDIITEVGALYNVSRLDLLSGRRHHGIALPRQVAMYLARHLTLLSLPQIGRYLGGRDHTTILYGVCKIEALVLSDQVLAAHTEILKARIQERLLLAQFAKTASA